MDIFSSWKRTIRYWFRTWKIMFTVQKYAENKFLTRTLIILTYSKRILIWRETGTVYTMYKYIANIHQKNRTHTCLKSNETDIIRVRTHTHTPTTRSTAQRHYIHSYLQHEMEHEMELRRTHTSVTGLLSLRISIFVIGFRKSCTFMIPFHVNLWKSKFMDWSMAGDRLRGKI